MNAPFQIMTSPAKVGLRVEDFLLLCGNGAFSKYSKAELIEGEIFVVNAIFSRHAEVTAELVFSLKTALIAEASDLRVYSPLSINLLIDSMPEPDIAVCMRHNSGPMPIEKVRLLVEVSDTTLDFDLGTKAALYAKAAVPEYWVADVQGAKIIRHWQPEADEYKMRDELPFGTLVSSATLPELKIETSGLVE
jgi:Uma2 family endonuclease